jgi:methyl-accepting chemotaxis protein
MKKSIGLQARILLFFSLFIVALCTLITAMSVRESVGVASAIFAQDGIKLTEKAAGFIDGDKFEALAASLNDADPFYEAVRQELFKMKAESTAHYFYTMAPYRGSTYRFIIDGSAEKGSPDFEPIGSEENTAEYEMAFTKAWQTKTAQFSPMQKDPDWGYMVSIYQPIKNSRGAMVGIIGCDFDARFLYESVRNQTVRQIILGIFLAAAGIVVMVFFMRLIFVRLARISDILRVISHGEGDLSTRIAIKRNDEIDNMAGLFNQTLEKICTMVALIKDQTINLSNVGNELSENMNQTAAAVGEITGNIQSIKGQAINQSASVTETNATMEQVMENINRLNTHVEAQTESVSQSSSAIEQMLANIQSVTSTLIKNAENVQRLTQASDVGRSSLEEVSQDIMGIAKESEGLLEINAVMENIASQTNLLSMNAAIEAAHAGEAGKGFAVVADEIRKLAENSSEQSKTISTVLKKIKESIDKITRSTGVVMDKFQAIDGEVRIVSEQESNIRAAMEEQSVGSKQILEAISQLHDLTQQVKQGSEEMLEGSREVINEGKNLAGATEEITNGINEIASGADYINAAIERVHLVSNNNREHIGALAGEVEKFKVQRTGEFVWDKTFAVGHEMIDSQHQELFAAINNIIRDCNGTNKAQGREDFKKNVDFLAGYVDKHFSEEEVLQQRHEYPDYPNHRRIHENFKKEVRDLSVKWLATGPTEETGREVRAATGDWLIAHIKAQDVRLGAYIRSRARAPA